MKDNCVWLPRERDGYTTNVEAPFTFARRSRESFVYHEGDRSATLYGEMLVGPVTFAFRRESIFRHWDPPHEDELITSAHKDVLLARLNAYMETTNTRFVLD